MSHPKSFYSPSAAAGYARIKPKYDALLIQHSRDESTIADLKARNHLLLRERDEARRALSQWNPATAIGWALAIVLGAALLAVIQST